MEASEIAIMFLHQLNFERGESVHPDSVFIKKVYVEFLNFLRN